MAKKKRRKRPTAHARTAPRPVAGEGAPERGWRLFHASLIGLTLLALVPLWGWRFPPMQDYPQRLFMAHVIGTFDDPALNWADSYVVDVSPGPYKLTFGLLYLFASVFDMETAGKIYLSLYVLLVALLALRAAEIHRRRPPPWPLLLLLPLSFHQLYYMGFLSYMASLPVVFLALIDLSQRVQAPLTVRRSLPQLGYQVLIFALHPIAVVMYLGFAFGSALLSVRRLPELKRALLIPTGLLVAFVLWYGVQYASGQGAGAMDQAAWVAKWWAAERTLRFFALMFTGMKITDGVDLVPTLVWSGIAVALLVAAIRSIAGRPRLRWEHVVLVLAVIAYGALPFWVFEVYSFFNARWAPVVCIALTLLVARAQVGRLLAGGLVAACALLLLLTARVHALGSAEVEQVVPVVSQMRTNARVLPLYFRAGSEVLDKFFYTKVHSHEVSYYHLLVGGGANPNLFPNTMLPVRYRTDVRLPSPRHLRQFSWDQHGAAYDYILTRGAPPATEAWLAQRASPVTRNGAWALFEVRR